MSWGWAIVAVAAGVWIYRQIGFTRFIRAVTPEVEQRKDVFKSTGERYTRTQEANKWRLRIRNPRTVQRRKSA